MRVPIRIEDDDGIGGGEIDSQPAGARGKQKTKVGRSFGVEVVQRGFAEIPANPAVQTLEREMAKRQILPQQIQHTDHLRKDQHPVQSGGKARKERKNENNERGFLAPDATARRP